MKRIVIAAAVAASSNMALAAPAPTPYYVSVNAGSAKQEFSAGGASATVSDTAFQIAGGYRIAPNVHVEVGYTNFGKSDAETNFGAATVKPEAVHVAITGAWRLTREFSVTGKVGVAHASTKLEGSIGSDTVTHTGLTAGAGVRYAITPTVAVSADYQHFGKMGSYDGVDLKAHVVSVGVRFSF